MSHKTTSLAILFSFLCISSFFGVETLSAATFSGSLKEEVRSKEMSVTLFLDADGERVNAYEGNVIFDTEVLSLERIETDNSIITTWLTLPSKGNSPSGDNSVRFEGLTQGGFMGVAATGESQLEKGKLFTLIFSAKKEVTTEVLVSGTRVYKADGEGSEAKSLDIRIPITVKKNFLKSHYFLPDFEGNLTLSQRVGDVHAEITSSQDVFDGKKFLIFENRNLQNSLVYFLVAESGTKDPEKIPSFSWTKAKSPYVLTDDMVMPYVHVKGVYADGTYSYATIASVDKEKNLVLWSYILCVVFLLVVAVYYASPRKQKNPQP